MDNGIVTLVDKEELIGEPILLVNIGQPVFCHFLT